jgi:hypothetical protein
VADRIIKRDARYYRLIDGRILCVWCDCIKAFYSHHWHYQAATTPEQVDSTVDGLERRLQVVGP